MGRCTPLFLCNTGRFPNQERGAAWVKIFSMTVAGLSDIQSCHSCASCHSNQVPLSPEVKSFTADFNCCWDQSSMTVNHLLSIPLNSILTTCGILITGCLFQTYSSVLLVALGAEKTATRDNGSTVAFSLSGQIPELTSSAIMVHGSNHSDIRW